MTQDRQKITTPFGGGRFSVALLERQIWIDEQRKNLSDNEKSAINKWQLLRALTEARAVYGLSDRSLVVLEALLSFYPESELNGMEDMIVFPSNHELSLRSRGMAPATLRRHLSALVKSGIIIRKDSPNGKRYCRRAADGGLGEAFGFNLASLALMASEIFEAADKCRAHEKARQAARTEITLHLRNARRLIDLALEEGRGDKEHWLSYEARLDSLSGRVSRTASLDELEERKNHLSRLMAEVENYWLSVLDDEELQDDYDDKNNNMSGNDLHTERHIHNSNTEYHLDNSIKNLKSGKAGSEPQEEPEKEEARSISLNRLYYCCPYFMSFASDEDLTWSNMKAISNLVRPMLGISTSAWREAVNIMGETRAIAILAYLTERHDEIKSPGGYLRKLTERAETGKLSLQAMFDSLHNRLNDD